MSKGLDREGLNLNLAYKGRLCYREGLTETGFLYRGTKSSFYGVWFS